MKQAFTALFAVLRERHGFDQALVVEMIGG
jgi:hypothetical protein